MDGVFTTILEIAGTFAFAISGIKLASGKQLDWFGAYVVGLVTAIGGGTARDLLLDVTPFWILDGKYFVVAGIALLAVLMFKEKVLRWKNMLFLFDAIGLGLFTIVGLSKSLDAGLPFWVCIVMGTITGSIGGVIRDVLLNEVPLLLRKKEIYAMACIAGGLVYYACLKLRLDTSLTELIAALTVIFARLIAAKFRLHLPQLDSLQVKEQEGVVQKDVTDESNQ